MYHYQPATALEELQEEAVLPHPVHVRDMIIRARLSPEHALSLENPRWRSEFSYVLWRSIVCRVRRLFREVRA
jgi:hypothetical protein